MSAGVYWIMQKSADRVVYVGSSANVPRRLRDHRYKLARGTHENSHLQRTWDKYGADDFELELLESTEHAVEREQFWLDFLGVTDRLCNIAKHAECAMLGYKHTEEAKRKMSVGLRGKVNSEETKLKMSLAKRGKAFSDEHRHNLSLAHLGYKQTEEERQKKSVSLYAFYAAKKGKIAPEVS